MSRKIFKPATQPLKSTDLNHFKCTSLTMNKIQGREREQVEMFQEKKLQVLKNFLFEKPQFNYLHQYQTFLALGGCATAQLLITYKQNILAFSSFSSHIIRVCFLFGNIFYQTISCYKKIHSVQTWDRILLLRSRKLDLCSSRS